MNQKTRKVIRARRANKGDPKGKHWTLTQVVNNPDKVFAFAVSDDGEEAYVPASVVKKENMTTADQGAGFVANTRKIDAYMADYKHPHIMLPIKWDGEFEEVEVEEEAPPKPSIASDEELTYLGDKLSDAQTALNDLVETIEPLMGLVPELKEKANTAKTELTVFRLTFDELFPEND